MALTRLLGFCNRLVSGVAANEAEREVMAAVYDVAVEGTAAPQAEIAEILWLDPENPPPVPVAPLRRDHMLREVKR